MTIVKRGKKNNPLQVGMLGLGHALVKCWEVQIDSGGWTGGVECGDEWGGVSWGGGGGILLNKKHPSQHEFIYISKVFTD